MHLLGLLLNDFILKISTAHNSDDLNCGIQWENNILPVVDTCCVEKPWIGEQQFNYDWTNYIFINTSIYTSINQGKKRDKIIITRIHH